MHRTVLFSIVAAAMAVGGVTVHASPAPVDAGRVAVTQLTFHLAHGRTVSLELRAGALSNGNALRVIAQRCDADGSCGQSTAYQSALNGAALTVDSSNAVAELRTTIAGHDVHVRWQPAGTNTEVVGGFETQGDTTSTSGSDYQGEAATTSVDVDGAHCTGDGAVGNGVFADTGAAAGSSAATPLSALRVPQTAALTCG